MAGLLAAAAAAVPGRQVTVLERDRLPDLPVPRHSVPQGTQPHVLLHRGLLAMEALLPGVREELIAAGGIRVNTGDLPWLGERGWPPVGVPSFEIVSATRPLVEQVVRRRVLALPGVRLREGVRVTGLERDGARWRVQVQAVDGAETVSDAEISEIVVDASGRGSRMPEWLSALGIDPGGSTEVDARLGYATRFYAREPMNNGFIGVVVASIPQAPRGGLALPVEGDRWMVSAVGIGTERPPRDAAGFEAFLTTLRDPALADLTARAAPLSEVAVHRQTANLRHHYDRVTGWPPGLLVVGDALCAFNPVYGQGIAVAAIEAELLRQALTDGFAPDGAAALLRRFVAATTFPWAVATGVDLKYPTTAARPGLAARLFDRWIAELELLQVHRDQRSRNAFHHVYHLMSGPSALLHPALIARVLRARALGRGPKTPRPVALDALAADNRSRGRRTGQA
jgi:flavin-dependent dehydrogenase